jgi:hypothetical protein
MASLIPSGSASGTGSMTLAAPVTNSNQTATLPDATGTVMVSGNMPAILATLGSNQTTVSGTYTKMQFNTVIFDTNSNFNASNYRYTPTVAGYYQINAIISAGNNGQTALIVLYKNGSAYIYGIDTTTTIYGAAQNLSALVYMNGTTDYLETYYLCNTAGVIMSTGVGNCYFSGCLMRAA